MCVNISKVNMFQHSKVSPGLDPAAILASVMMMNLVFVAIKYEIHDYFHEILEIAPWLKFSECLLPAAQQNIVVGGLGCYLEKASVCLIAKRLRARKINFSFTSATLLTKSVPLPREMFGNGTSSTPNFKGLFINLSSFVHFGDFIGFGGFKTPVTNMKLTTPWLEYVN